MVAFSCGGNCTVLEEKEQLDEGSGEVKGEGVEISIQRAIR